jgi:hypothetical protein
LANKDYKEKPTIYYFEVFAHVARLDTTHMLISISLKIIEKYIKWILSLHQKNDRIFMSRKIYASDILKKFKTELLKPIFKPDEEKLKLTRESDGINSTHCKKLIGSLYLTAIRPNIV